MNQLARDVLAKRDNAINMHTRILLMGKKFMFKKI